MTEIIVGTTNESKVKQIRGALAPLSVSVKGIGNKDLLPQINEDGKTAVENARKKAVAYAKTTSLTILSMDNALYFKNLMLSEQPGLNVRRIPGGNSRPTDEELLAYYSNLIQGLGGQTEGHWEFGICVAAPQGCLGETTIISPRLFTAKASSIIAPGYPLESLQIDPESGKYISEMTQVEQDIFWQKAIGKPLCNFVSQIINPKAV